MTNTHRALVNKHFLVTIFIVYLSCTPPRSLLYLEGNPVLINKINNIIESSGIDPKYGNQDSLLDNNKTLFAIIAKTNYACQH